MGRGFEPGLAWWLRAHDAVLGYLIGKFTLALLHASQKLIHAGVDLLGTIDGEGDLGDMAHIHSIPDLGADEASRCHQASKGFIFFLRRSGDGDEDPATLSSGRKDNLRHVTRSNAWVGEFAFKHCGDLFCEGVDDSTAVIGSGSLFGHN